MHVWRRRGDAAGDGFRSRLALAPTLAAVCEADLGRLAAQARERRYLEGDVIVHEGEPGAGFFILVEGAASVSVEGMMVRGLAPGDVFGEVALLYGRPRSATVIAATDAICLLLDSRQFAGFLADHTAVAHELRGRIAHYAP